MKRLIDFGVAGTASHQYSLVPALLLVLFSLTFTTAASAAELIVNGGFEAPVVDPALGWMTYHGQNKPLGAADDCPTTGGSRRCNDDVRVPGWLVFWTDDIINHEQLNPGRLEIQTGDIADTPAYEGLQKAELDAHHRVGDDNNNATIVQLLPTCPLSDYTLTYAWKSRTDIEGDNDVRVFVDANPVNVHMVNEAWQEETVDFTSDNSGQTLILFGSIGDETTTGMFLDGVSVTGPDCSLVCEQKPYDITLRYDGDDDSNHDQTGNEVVISPEVVYPFPDPATIKVYGHKKKGPKLLGTYEVGINGLFSVSNIKSNKRIPPRLTFEIYNEGGAGDPVQTVTFHTSCSQPLSGGDEFGAITVWNALP